MTPRFLALGAAAGLEAPQLVSRRPPRRAVRRAPLAVPVATPA